jgi:hypothetical protein
MDAELLAELRVRLPDAERHNTLTTVRFLMLALDMLQTKENSFSG